MTVVVLADFAHVNGGAGRIALDGARGLARRGHTVIVFTAVGPIADDLRDVSGLTCICLDQPDVWNDPHRFHAAVRGIWNRTAARQFGALLAGLDPRDTVIHLHSWTKGLSASVVRVARSLGFAIVGTLHDFLAVCPTGTLFNHRTGAACTLAPLSPRCMVTACDARGRSLKAWRVVRHLVQQSVGGLPRRVPHLIAVSAASRDYLRHVLPPGCRVHTVPNFTEAPFDPPADVARHAAILFVGRLSREKGPLLLADCLARLGLPAVFVGEGELEAGVRARCPHAEITGWLSPDGVRARMRAARAIVVPSLWFETQGLVVAEAAAVGLPALVPHASAARDWVAHGRSGLWFRSGDADALCAAIAQVSDSPALAARMGRAAYDRFWAAPPTVEAHVAALEAVYGDMLDRRPGAGAGAAASPPAARRQAS
jgi:glycosyltransferase involved in cell wall biosynthesis